MQPTLLDTISVKSLDNGLKIICLKKSDAPVVAVQVWYKTGSANEHKGIYGLSHMLEHMMFRGSKEVASEEHARKINDIGGHCNAFTAEDITAYTNSVPKDHLAMILDLERDRMVNLTLDPEIFETERNVIIEEYHTYMNNPVAKAFLEFRTVFYQDHPYQVSPLGVIEDISSVTVENLKEYYSKWYAPNNATVVVVGDFKNPEQVFSMVEERFGQFPRQQKLNSTQENKVVPFYEQNRKGVWMKRRVNFDVPIIITGYPAPASGQEDILPLDILQIIISQGESSRLHREVVRKQSLAVMAGGMNHSLKQAGMSMFFAVFTPDMGYKKVEIGLNKQLEIIKDKGISDDEMEKVKNIALTSRTFDMYSAEHICQKIGYAETVDGDYQLWVKKLEALETLKKEQLIDTAKKYWNSTNRHTLYLRPKKMNLLLFVVGFFRRFLPKG